MSSWSKWKATHKFLLLSTVLNLNVGFATLAEDLEGEMLHIGLNFGIVEFTTDETFGIENTMEKELVSSDGRIRWENGTYVLWGFMATWFFAASPIRRSLSEKETYDGVVRLPWSLAMISTRSFCHTPTHLMKKSKKPVGIKKKTMNLRVSGAQIDSDGFWWWRHVVKSRVLVLGDI